MYRNLKAEMARNDLTMGDIAKALNVRRATISDKMNGKYRFYYDECLIIKKTFFPDLPIEYLFEKDDPENNKKIS
ncbi:helix-turn-helix transcriptional regulator [Aeribacillus pallidus]|jgi:DNA-binding XRE family transcriptional regulator|uniref:helix-turn-helix transcriptional regulator n=1 Tax=Aeribacillus pallidus TaxID=33936 RepID=UPI003D24C323